MFASKIARAAVLALCGSAIPAAAAVQAPPVPAGREISLNRDERAAIQALQMAASGIDRAAQDAALAAARAAATSADARYAVAHYQLEIARQRQDAPMLAQAVDALVDSGRAGPDELSSLLASQASRAFSANDINRADRLLARAVEQQPSNAMLVADHAQIKARLGDRPQAIALFQRAIGLQQAAGQRVPESWHRRALALAYDGRLAPQSIALARSLVLAYPNPTNWRDALLVYRAVGQPDPALDLDIRRLMRASQGLGGERDYLDLAQALNEASPGEAKAVLDEGVTRGMLDANEAIVRQLSTAVTRRATAERGTLARLRTQALAAATGASARSAGDAHFGQGQYAEAAELYRAALLKGGEDPNLVNSRLGAALALAGQRAEAETALRAVTGPRADLAGFWLAWLAQPMR